MTEPRSSGKRPLKIVPSCLSTSWRHIDVFVVIIIIKWRLWYYWWGGTGRY